MTTTTWTGTATALSSIAHGGETRGTITMLRREVIVLPDNTRVDVPIISGNAFRGRLRRVGEELLRDVLRYEGHLAPAAAHALRGGGALAKTGHEPLSGNRLQALRNLVPQIGVFGAAGGGTIIDGALDVSKVIPHVLETNHITGAHSTVSAFSATQLEAYTRQDDTDDHDFSHVMNTTSSSRTVKVSEASQQMLFNIETFPAGTTFTTRVRLRRPSKLELAFFSDVLAAYTADAHLGGRLGIGHGHIRLDLTQSPHTPTGDWRTTVSANRRAILTALDDLT